MAAVKWEPAGTPERSLLFLSAMVVAALFAGLTVASGGRYLDWMDERARRLEVERDQQAVIAAAAERTRIARELHDIVSHSLSIVITLADAGAVVSRADPARGVEAMTEVSEVGRRALPTCGRCSACCAPTGRPPAGAAAGIGDLGAARGTIQATDCRWTWPIKAPISARAAAELTAYRIVQESLTNTLRQLPPGTLRSPSSTTSPRSGCGSPTTAPRLAVLPRTGTAGHGIDGMRERVALHGGTLCAGRPSGLASRGHPGRQP